MKQKQKRLTSLENQLELIYEDLFGQKYVVGLHNLQKTEFNSIIETFRENAFEIRHLQEERTKKEQKRNFKQSHESIRINNQIRSNIKNAEQILVEAVKRLETDLKGKEKQIYNKIKLNRQNAIKNCFQLLKDVKEEEEGGRYIPPPSYQTLSDIKKSLFKRQEVTQENFNFEEENAMDKMQHNDKQIDEMLGEVIKVDGQIRKQVVNANQMIDITGKQIKKTDQKVQEVTRKIAKAHDNLLEVLTKYRRPNKLCLDITLVLLILALVGVIINMLKNG